jgi:hypothetical protein
MIVHCLSIHDREAFGAARYLRTATDGDYSGYDEVAIHLSFPTYAPKLSEVG